MARTQQAAQANITLQEQIEAIHKAKGLVGEDETKEKIGPSKPSEIHHPPPIPSSAPILLKPNPPISTMPRPPSSVRRFSRDRPYFSFYVIQILFFFLLAALLIPTLVFAFGVQTVATSCTHHAPLCRTGDPETTGGSCGSPRARPSPRSDAAYDSCASHQRGASASKRASHHGSQTTPHGCSCR